MRSQRASAAGAHWEEFWRDGSGDGEVMGGEAQRPVLDRFWRTFLAGVRLTAGDRVLDLAAGAAPIARLALRELDEASRPCFVVADYAPSALASAQKSLGRAVLPVACDMLRLPFSPRSFSAVVSQFGLEYAGAKAFAAAAEMVADGGRLAAIIHYRSGAIEAECRENAAAAATLMGGRVFARARTALQKSYKSGRADESREETAFAEALARANERLEQLKRSTGRELSLRYAGDLAQLSARRFAYSPQDAFSWLGAVSARLGAYRSRMDAMIAAARGEADMADIARRLQSAGLVDISFEPLIFRAGDAPGAWTLKARRP
jgi:ubiquinone/menaquinone biosynthesis C-methylase UbiE